jgi:uncharacterized protein YdaU (DUF1376 family)
MTKKPDLWMPFYVGDYLADTQHLSCQEHGAYDLLLFHGWMHEGKIPADDARLARICKLSAKEWQEIKPVILRFFNREGDHLTQKRQVAELGRAKAIQEGLRVKGRRGAEKRWHRNSSGNAPAIGPGNAPAIAQPMAGGMPGDAPPQPPPQQQLLPPTAGNGPGLKGVQEGHPGANLALQAALKEARALLAPALRVTGMSAADVGRWCTLLRANPDPVIVYAAYLASKDQYDPPGYGVGVLRNGGPSDELLAEAKRALYPNKPADPATAALLEGIGDG